MWYVVSSMWYVGALLVVGGLREDCGGERGGGRKPWREESTIPTYTSLEVVCLKYSHNLNRFQEKHFNIYQTR